MEQPRDLTEQEINEMRILAIQNGEIQQDIDINLPDTKSSYLRYTYHEDCNDAAGKAKVTDYLVELNLFFQSLSNNIMFTISSFTESNHYENVHKHYIHYEFQTDEDVQNIKKWISAIENWIANSGKDIRIKHEGDITEYL